MGFWTIHRAVPVPSTVPPTEQVLSTYLLNERLKRERVGVRGDRHVCALNTPGPLLVVARRRGDSQSELGFAWIADITRQDVGCNQGKRKKRGGTGKGGGGQEWVRFRPWQLPPLPSEAWKHKPGAKACKPRGSRVSTSRRTPVGKQDVQFQMIITSLERRNLGILFTYIPLLFFFFKYFQVYLN